MTIAIELLNRAAGQLQAAAAHADELGRQQDSATLLAFAGQIRLNAAGLSHDVDPTVAWPIDGSIAAQLQSALDTLDEIHPLEGPPDLPVWSWYVADLVRLAKDWEAP